MLLSGSAPFNGATAEEIMGKVLIGKWGFNGKVWQGISAEGKDFVTQLLTYDPDDRPTAQKILEHEWIQKNLEVEVTEDQVWDFIQNMLKFQAVKCTLHSAVMQFIVQQLMPK